jgi:hypothetical protein
MCLVTDKLDKNIAKEDMVVYKILCRKMSFGEIIIHSPYIYFPYEINKLYKTEIKETKDFSYYDSQVGDYYFSSKNKKSFKSFDEGFHSAKTVERLNDVWLKSGKSIYECIIPAGSEYYEDNTDLIVSNQIIITNKICA